MADFPVSIASPDEEELQRLALKMPAVNPGLMEPAAPPVQSIGVSPATQASVAKAQNLELSKPGIDTLGARIHPENPFNNPTRQYDSGIKGVFEHIAGPAVKGIEWAGKNIGAPMLKDVVQPAANVLAPGVMATIPGTEMHHTLEKVKAEGDAETALKREKLDAETGYYNARENGAPKHLGQYTNDKGQVVEVFQNPDGTLTQQVAGAGKEANLSEQDKAIKDYLVANGLEDTPANRDKARSTLKLDTRYPKPMTGGYSVGSDAKTGRPVQEWDLGGGKTEWRYMDDNTVYNPPIPTEPKPGPVAKPREKLKPLAQNEPMLSPGGFPILGEVAAEGGPGSPIFTGLFPQLKVAGANAAEQRASNAARAEGNSDRSAAKDDLSPVIVVSTSGKTYLMSKKDVRGFDPKTVQSVMAADPQEVVKARSDLANANAFATNFSKYQQDFNKLRPELSRSDLAGIEILTSHLKTDGNFLSSLVEGLPIAGPISKFFDSGTTRQIYRSLSPQAKQMMAEYYTAVVDNFGNMKQIMGSVGRNEIQLQAEVNTIPLPYIDVEAANDQFGMKISDLKSRFSALYRVQGMKYPFDESQQAPSPDSAKFHYQGQKGQIFSNDGKTWYDDKGNQVK